ncbi:MAG TPA: FKBP-type peptidyl-prolyl cis-trans isomerase [Bacteroidales bacterium]|nr:FKBP-type peptidyl-prolyl cis-trans isomerase [Bacteroidales bacterium]
MKKYILVSAILVLVAAVSSPSFAQKKEKKKKGEAAGNTAPVAAKPLFANNNDTISYIIGADIAHSFAKNSLDLNRDMVFKGFMDAQAKTDTVFTEEEIGAIMMAWQQEMGAKKAAQSEIELAKNKKIGEDYLAANSLNAGVIKLPSGLQYKVIKEGSGESPDDNDVVTVHYTGTLVDGTVFDSSRERGEPIEFPVNGVISGWTEALKLMKPGSQFMLYIPADLAYGDKKTGPIPEGSTLIFDVELLKIEKK